ncbi:MAG: DUF3108 domain-containing protein [Gemmatimonadetes bacterium]|nr:DUF3108 domain-containing protein [Gemmatimonadota bacterium]
MMRSLSLATLLATLLATPALPQNGGPSLPEVPFDPGERLQFSIGYGSLPAGTMSIQVAGLTRYEDRPAYHIVFDAQTNRAVSFVYELDTHEESWFDAQRFWSLRYLKRSTENGEQRTRDYRFDQQRSLRIEPDGQTKPASPRAVDQLAFMYYIRLLPLKPGAKFVLRNSADPDDNPVTVRVLKKERVKVPAGTYEAWVLDLDLTTDSGVFKKGGENRIWITADERKMPVKISSKIGLGSFLAELVRSDAG